MFIGVAQIICGKIVLFLVREDLKKKTKDYDKSENDLKALQSVGQIVGEVLKQLTEEKCKYFLYSLILQHFIALPCIKQEFFI